MTLRSKEPSDVARLTVLSIPATYNKEQVNTQVTGWAQGGFAGDGGGGKGHTSNARCRVPSVTSSQMIEERSRHGLTRSHSLNHAFAAILQPC